MSMWFAIMGMAVVTLIVRAAPLLLRDRLSPELEHRLGAVPIAVFTALAIPPLIINGGATPQFTFGAPLIAGIAGVLAAWHSNNVVITIVVGMTVYWLIRLLTG